MRRFTVILLTAVFCPTLAGAWGFLSQCVTNGTKGKTMCLGDSFVAAGAVPCVNVTVTDFKGRSGEEGEALRRNLHESFQQAFNAWINTVRNTIQSSGREAEFADFLQSFPAQLEVRIDNVAYVAEPEQKQKTKRRGKKAPAPAAPAPRPSSADSSCMAVTVEVGYEGDGRPNVCADALYNKIRWYAHYLEFYKDDAPMLSVRRVTSCEDDPNGVLTHEIGHLFGLADLYWNKLEHSSEKYALVEDFSLLRMGIQSKDMTKHSLMGSSEKGKKRSVGCDDVDALINMADLVAVKQNKVSPRIKNGWKSFCPDYSSFSYAYGQPYKTAEEYEQNKKRIEAVLFFEKSYAKWNREYNRLTEEIDALNDSLNKAPRPLTTVDLMKSAKVSYLEDLRDKVMKLYPRLKSTDRQKPILEQYEKMLKEEKQLSSFYDEKVLEEYKPHEVHLEAAVAKRSHHCVVCSKLIPPEDEGRKTLQGHTVYFHSGCIKNGRLPNMKLSAFNNYVKKYGYDREKTAAPALTYAQLKQQASQDSVRLAMANADLGTTLREPTVSGAEPPAANTRVTKPAGKPAAKSATKPAANTSAKRAGTPTVVPSSADQFSETALAGRPRAQVKSIPTPPAAKPANTSAKPAAKSAANPAELVCAVCGKKIATEAEAYTPPDKDGGPVHKHSECAYKYFSRFYSVDNASLDRYDQSYFFSKEPADVTAAKGMMKKLGLTPAEVKSYASSSREAYRAQEQKRQQQQQNEAAAKPKRQQDDKKCSSYAVVTADDVKAFETANRAAFSAIASREKAGKKLTEKQKRLKRRLAQLKADKVRTDYCQKVK